MNEVQSIYNEFAYKKSLGTISSAIPLIFFLIIAFITSTINLSNLIWALINFIPIIILSNFVEIVYKRIPYIHKTHIFFKFIIAWMTLFPIGRIISDIIFLVVYKTFFYENFILPFYIILLIVLGLIYGVFFISVYIFLYRIYLRALKKRKRGIISILSSII